MKRPRTACVLRTARKVLLACLVLLVETIDKTTRRCPRCHIPVTHYFGDEVFLARSLPSLVPPHRLRYRRLPRLQSQGRGVPLVCSPSPSLFLGAITAWLEVPTTPRPVVRTTGSAKRTARYRLLLPRDVLGLSSLSHLQQT